MTKIDDEEIFNNFFYFLLRIFVHQKMNGNVCELSLPRARERKKIPRLHNLTAYFVLNVLRPQWLL